MWRTCDKIEMLERTKAVLDENSEQRVLFAKHSKRKQWFGSEKEDWKSTLSCFARTLADICCSSFSVSICPGVEGNDFPPCRALFFWLESLYTWAATILKGVKEQETQGDQRRKLFSDTYGAIPNLACEHLVGKIALFEG